MKKIVAMCFIALAVACGSNETTESETSEGVDSAANVNPEKNINDSPMRTRDTTSNVSRDTMEVGDSVTTPR